MNYNTIYIYHTTSHYRSHYDIRREGMYLQSWLFYYFILFLFEGKSVGCIDSTGMPSLGTIVDGDMISAFRMSKALFHDMYVDALEKL